MKQTQKHLGGLLAAGVGAVALGLYAYWGVFKKDAKEAEAKAQAEQLFSSPAPLTPESFTRITVEAQGTWTTLEKRGATWQLTRPVPARANLSVVNGLLEAMIASKVLAIVEEAPSPEALRKYGLAQPAFIVTAQREGGANQPSVSLSLKGGIENTFDGSLYVQKPGDARVYAVPGNVRTALQRSSFDLRDPKVLSFDDASLQSVRLVKGAPALTLTRTSRTTWKVQGTKASASAADPEVVQSWLQSLHGLSALSFPPASPERQKSLLTPALELTFTFSPGTEGQLRVPRLEPSAEGRLLAAWTQGPSTEWVELPAQSLEILERRAQTFEDMRVLHFEMETLAQVDFHPQPPGPVITLKRERVPSGDAWSEWKLTAPQAGKAPQWKLSSLLGTLSRVKATARVQGTSRAGSAGLVPRVVLKDVDGKELEQLQLGKAVPGKPDQRYAGGTHSGIFEVATSVFNDLPTDASGWIEASASPPPP